MKNIRLAGRELPWHAAFDLALLVGIAILLTYTFAQPARLRSTAVSLLIAGAASAVGFFTGFLFGIPRTLQHQPTAQTAGGSLEGAGGGYATNTNLEQISDWLTKIIVGVGLVQLTQLPPKFGQLATYLAGAFDLQPAPSAAVTTIILYFGTFGFLMGYLWTRLNLAGAFSQAEREARERPEFYEGIIHSFLYQPMPGGFQNAIVHGEEYNRRFGPNNERVSMYLACAYAQRYAFLSRAPQPDESALADTRKKALGAVGRALQLNPKLKPELRELWDPARANPLEDDLTVFFDDPDFARHLAEEKH